MIDPVMVWYSPQSDYKGIYPDALKAITGVKEATGLDAITRDRVAAGNSYIIAATIEVGFYDSTTNQLLGAYRDSARADPIRREAGGATWGQVKAALDAWAKKPRARVDVAQSGR